MTIELKNKKQCPKCGVYLSFIGKKHTKKFCRHYEKVRNAILKGIKNHE